MLGLGWGTEGEQIQVLITINDEALPDEHDWALLQVDGTTYIAIKRSKMDRRVIAEAMAARRLALRGRAA